MPVHVKGGGGAGFPQGWKENFKGVAHESAIAKGDPVVCGVYSDITNGMDVRSLSVANTYYQTYVDTSPDGEMFVVGGGAANNPAAIEKYINIWNSATLVFDKVAIPVGTTAFATKLRGVFSKDNKYLALLVSTNLVASGITYLKLYRIDGTGAARTLTFLKEQSLTSGASVSCIEFFDYLNDATKLRIVCTPYSGSGSVGYLIKYDTMTQVLSYAALGMSLSAGFVKIDEYTLLSVAADTYNNRRFHADVPGDTFSSTYDKYLFTQGGSNPTYDFTDDLLYAVQKTSTVSPYFKVYKDDGTFTWTAIANPDVLPAGSVISGAFSPGGTYLAVGLSVSPWLVIYKRTGDVLTKIANPTTMPTKGVYDVTFSDNGKLLFAAQGDATAAPGVFCYGFESGNIVSKITSFSANPLGWFPAGRKKFGIALDSGAIGSEVRVNLFPKLNNMLPQ